MKFLLLGKGKTTLSISKYFNSINVDYCFAVNEEEKDQNDLLFDKKLLDLKDIDFVIKSPGISQNNKIFKKIRKRFKVISELDLLYLFDIKTKVIAITGSNGKTTCVSLIYKMLKNANLNVILCGNSHNPIFDYYTSFNSLDYLIVELSSFQLEDLRFYHPFISSIINLEENHLDAVKSIKKYYNSKKNIYKYTNKLDYFIYNSKIRQIKEHKINATIVNMDSTVFYKFDIPNHLLIYKTQLMILYAIKNLLNIESKYFIKTLFTFKALPYRTQTTIFNDITFINDSKSTSISATLFAFENINENSNVILIVGGKDKKLNYKTLKKLNYYRLVVYGQLRHKIVKKIKNVIVFEFLDEAFRYSTSLKIHNKVILFSPAASSFDQYNNYQERGKHFNDLLMEYIHEQEKD